MTHLDEGTLQAYLDDEMDAGRKAGIAEHLLSCRECRGVVDELRSANDVFRDAVAHLDTVSPPEHVAPGVGAGAGSTGRSFVRAAGLVLLLTAAASAAVPGSPLRQWLEARFTGGAPATEEAVPATARDSAQPAAPAGVGLTVDEEVVVEVSGLADGAIRLVEKAEGSVSVRAVGGSLDPTFRTGAGRIEVRGGVGGELTVEWPSSLVDARLYVDGVLYAARVDGALRVLVDPERRTDGRIVWR